MKKQISRVLGIAGLLLTLIVGYWLGAYAPMRNESPADGRGAAARAISLRDDALRFPWPGYPAPFGGGETEPGSSR